MARAPLKRCAKPGCSALVRGQSRCDKHRKEQQRSYNKDRPSPASRGYDHRWRKFRKAFLAENPLCVACKARGRVTAASVVDHVTPHRDRPGEFWNTEFQAMCKPCHSAKTRRE